MHTNKAGDSPLHIAINTKHAGEISLLLRAGANPTMRNAQGKSPLDNLGVHTACHPPRARLRAVVAAAGEAPDSRTAH